MEAAELVASGRLALPTVEEDLLDSVRWPAQTCHRHGDIVFRLRSNDVDFAAHLDGLLAGFPVVSSEPHCTYTIVSGVRGVPSWWIVLADGVRISTSDDPSIALIHFFGHLNRAIVRHGPADAVMLHAAACAWQGRVVVLAGPTESGKSTLAAGLGLAGLEYLTDEVTTIDAASLHALPYPKPLSIDEGAWADLSSLRPPEMGAGAGTRQWHVDPRRLPGGLATAPLPVAAVVRLRWRPGAALRMVPASRARTLIDLALDMFRPRDRLAWQVSVLADLLRSARAAELEYSRLDDAVVAVRRLLGGEDPGSSAYVRRFT